MLFGLLLRLKYDSLLCEEKKKKKKWFVVIWVYFISIEEIIYRGPADAALVCLKFNLVYRQSERISMKLLLYIFFTF